MTKKQSRHKKVSVTPTHILLQRSLAIYAILVFVLFIVFSLAGYAVMQYATLHHNNGRQAKINTIYSSLKLDESYRPVKSNVFGDKRPYDWDGGRSFSSSVEYGHNDTFENTKNELKTKIEAAGFTQIGTAYEGSTAPQQHYKNAAGNYIRVTITPKLWHDSAVYGTPTPEEIQTMDVASAPVYVTIKVNLDDNNE
ncbi:MAG: hypothetical protein WAQ25_05075 [Candidatus Saccharimonas sp.]